MPGYLSLHQTAHSLTIKWTPNQLMNGYPDADKQDNKKWVLNIINTKKKNVYIFVGNKYVKSYYIKLYNFAFSKRP